MGGSRARRKSYMPLCCLYKQDLNTANLTHAHTERPEEYRESKKVKGKSLDEKQFDEIN
jgi:hypothetical protein